MKNLYNKLHESLLDADFDNVMSGVEATIIEDWLKKYASGKYKIMKLKNGTHKLWGSIVISKYDGETFPALNLSYVEGSIYIEHCDANSLQGLFASDCRVTDSVHITDCNNLTDLSGSPSYIQGWLYITSCKSLRSLEGGPDVLRDISIMKCGKRFKQNTIRQKFPSAYNILCAAESEVANINESLMDPVLIRFMEQIKKLNMRSGKAVKLSALVGNTNLQLDKVTPSMRQTFNVLREKPKMLTAARKIIKNNQHMMGIILCEDDFGNFIAAFNPDYESWFFYIDKDGKLKKEYPYTETYKSSTEIISALDKFHTTHLLTNLCTVHIYNFSEHFKELNTYDIQDKRAKEKTGMIDMSPDGLRELLREQKRRYKVAAEQLKATKNSEQYQKRANKVAELMERFAKFIKKTIQDPQWYNNQSWRISEVFDAFNEGYHAPNKWNKYPVQNYGLIYVFKSWVSSSVAKLTGSSSYSTFKDGDLDKAINRADKALAVVGL